MSQFENRSSADQCIKSTLRVGLNFPIAFYRFAQLVYEVKGWNFDERIRHLVATDINDIHRSGGFTEDLISKIEESYPFLKLSPTDKSDLASKVELGAYDEK